MKKIFIPYLCFLFGQLICSCSADDIATFVSEDYLYFNLNQESDKVFPEIVYTFFFEPEAITAKEFIIPVKIAGRYPVKDLQFTLTPVDSLSTAQEGVHYTIDNSTQTIKSGEAEGQAKITLHRKPEMKEKEFYVTLQINNSGDILAGHKPLVKIRITDFFIMPEWWSIHGPSFWPTHNHRKTIHYYLGEYTEQKCLLFLEYKKITDGSDPWATPEYMTTSKDYLGNIYEVVSEAAARADILGFKSWLKTEKGDPFDAQLNMKISESVGLPWNQI